VALSFSEEEVGVSTVHEWLHPRSKPIPRGPTGRRTDETHPRTSGRENETKASSHDDGDGELFALAACVGLRITKGRRGERLDRLDP